MTFVHSINVPLRCSALHCARDYRWPHRTDRFIEHDFTSQLL